MAGTAAEASERLFWNERWDEGSGCNHQQGTSHALKYYTTSTDKQDAHMLKIKHVEELLLCKVVAIGCKKTGLEWFMWCRVSTREQRRALLGMNWSVVLMNTQILSISLIWCFSLKDTYLHKPNRTRMYVCICVCVCVCIHYQLPHASLTLRVCVCVPPPP